jgi:uncharacterized membrane protein
MRWSRKLTLFFVLAAFVVALALYPRLPASMPIHFDWQGRPDGYMAKWPGAFLTAFVMLGLFVTGLLARVVKARSGEEPSRAGDVIELMLHGFLCEANAVVLLFASGHPISIPRALLGGLGIFFAVVGNYLGKLRRNHLVGIRTPWTLGDDENWLLTHRLGDPVFMLGGAVLTLSALAGAPSSFLWLVLAVTTLVPTAYSYLLSTKGKAAQ